MMRRKEREVTDYNKMIEMLKSCDCCRIGLVDDKGEIGRASCRERVSSPV